MNWIGRPIAFPQTYLTQKGENWINTYQGKSVIKEATLDLWVTGVEKIEKFFNNL